MYDLCDQAIEDPVPVSIVILATRTQKRIKHQTQQKTSRPYFVVRFFYG